MNQLTLEIKNNGNGNMHVHDFPYLNTNQERRLRPLIRARTRAIETAIRECKTTIPTGQLFKLSVICWGESTSVLTDCAISDPICRKAIDDNVDAIVVLMTGKKKPATETARCEPNKVEPLTEEQFNALDPGIRRTVKWLRENGFETTDSGDGSKAATMECALNYPNVAIRIDDPDALQFEADRLYELLSGRDIDLAPQGTDCEPYIQATYDPADGSAILLLMYVNDELLFGSESIPDSGD
jgi:hypothetical protein